MRSWSKNSPWPGGSVHHPWKHYIAASHRPCPSKTTLSTLVGGIRDGRGHTVGIGDIDVDVCRSRGQYRCYNTSRCAYIWNVNQIAWANRGIGLAQCRSNEFEELEKREVNCSRKTRKGIKVRNQTWMGDKRIFFWNTLYEWEPKHWRFPSKLMS